MAKRGKDRMSVSKNAQCIIDLRQSLARKHRDERRAKSGTVGWQLLRAIDINNIAIAARGIAFASKSDRKNFLTVLLFETTDLKYSVLSVQMVLENQPQSEHY